MPWSQEETKRVVRLESSVYGQVLDFTPTYGTLTNVTLPFTNTTVIDGQTLNVVNGVTYALLGQVSIAQNGIYTVTSLNPFKVERVNNLRTYDNIFKARLQITHGTLQGNWYQLSTFQPFTIDVTPIIVDPIVPPVDPSTAIPLKADKVTGATSGNLAGLDATGNLIDSGVATSIDVTLGLNSDILIPTQRAIKTYVDNATVGLLDDRGNWDASGGFFPEVGGSGIAGSVLRGDLWFISVAGILGGQNVTIGDCVRALEDSPLQDSSKWSIMQVNITYVPENQDNKSTDNTLGGINPSDILYPSQKAVKDYADTKASATLPSGQIIVGNASNVATPVTLSQDATISNAGELTISPNVITNSKLAQAPANTYKGNPTGAIANEQDVVTKTAFNQDFETTTSVFTQPSRTVSTGISNNIIRADAVMPLDSKKQNRIISVASEAQMLGLVENEALNILLDINNTRVYRTDEQTTYQLIGTPASVISNWQRESGFPQWTSSTVYSTSNIFVKHLNKLYRSKIPVPANNNPFTDVSELYWELVADATVSDIRTIANRVANLTSNVSVNPKYGTDTFQSGAGVFYARTLRSETTVNYTAQDPLSFTFYTRDGIANTAPFTGVEVQNFVSTHYDAAGVITDLGANGNTTVGVMYANPSVANQFAFLLGQQLYTGGTAVARAKAEASLNSFVVPVALQTWKELGRLVYRRDLVAQSNFDDESRFAWITQGIGGGGVIQDASTTVKGIVQLSNAINGTSQTLAATELAVGGKADKAPNFLLIPNLPSGGSIGLATATVDIYEKFKIAQTTGGQTITLPSPTNTANQKIVYVENTGGVTTFFMYGIGIGPSTQALFTFNGITWVASASAPNVYAVGNAFMQTNFSGALSPNSNTFIDPAGGSYTFSNSILNQVLSVNVGGLGQSNTTTAVATILNAQTPGNITPASIRLNSGILELRTVYNAGSVVLNSQILRIGAPIINFNNSQHAQAVNTLALSDSSQNFATTAFTKGNLALKADKIPVSLDIPNLPTGGVIGLATATVDIFEKFNINQTTPNQAITLPIPTVSSTNKVVYVLNLGTTSFTMYGEQVEPGRQLVVTYDGVSGLGWIPTYGKPSGTIVPVDTVQTITGTTTLANFNNGAYIRFDGASDSTLTLPSAGTNAGQTVKVTNLSTSAGVLTVANTNLTCRILRNQSAILQSDGIVWNVLKAPDNELPRFSTISQKSGSRGAIFIYKDQLYQMGLGSNTTTPFGFNTETDIPTLVPVVNTGNIITGWKDIVYNYDNALALTNDGRVFGWGENITSSVAGVSNYLATQIIFPGNPIIDKIFINATRQPTTSPTVDHSFMAIDTLGRLYAWGNNNSWGQLGIGTTGVSQATPVRITLAIPSSNTGTVDISNVVFTDVSIGNTWATTVAALDNTGQIYVWGYGGNVANGNPFGDGVATANLNKSRPYIVPLLNNCTQVAVSGSFDGGTARATVRVIRVDGSSWACGVNTGGELARGNIISSSTFVRENTNSTDFIKIFSINSQSSGSWAIIRSNGTLSFAGRSVNGNFGINTATATAVTSFDNSAYPTLTGAGFQGFMNEVAGGIKPKVIGAGSVSTALSSMYILDNRGIVWVAGRGDWGQLGIGATTVANIVFSKMILPSNLKAVDIITLGYDNVQGDTGCIVIMEDGTMMSCGLILQVLWAMNQRPQM